MATLGTLAVLCLGIWWGGHPSQLPSFMRTLFVANANDVVLGEALNDIQHDFYHRVGRTGLIDGAIAGAVSTLGDPYAAYYTAHDYTSFNNPQPKRFSGIGIDVATARDGLLVENIVPGSPAAGAGMHPGDVITAVGGRLLAGFTSARSIDLIRGRIGTTVQLTVRRGTAQLRFGVKRELIPTPVVQASIQHYGAVAVGVIYLPTFDIPGIHAQVAQNLESLLSQHVKGIVLDLRDNGGGLVSEAQLVVSMFVAHGKVVTTRGRTQTSETLYVTGNPIAPTIPLVVLVNRNTASAAEITTGALKDHHRAVVVGTRTYGKGVFQEIRPLSNGGALDITVGQYFLPNGENLGAGGFRRGVGIAPNVVVTAAPTASTDPPLQAALRILAARAH